MNEEEEETIKSWMWKMKEQSLFYGEEDKQCRFARYTTNIA